MSAENSSTSVAEALMHRALKFKAQNPLFAKYLELWNERAGHISALRLKQRVVEGLTRELDEIREKLSPEEREIL